MRGVKSIQELEEELKVLKQRERAYMKLGLKVKDLEEKERRVRRASQDTVIIDDNQQIDKLKAELQSTLADIKRVDQDTKNIKNQSKSLENQLKALSEVLKNLTAENRSRRQRIQLKDEELIEKENEVESVSERRRCNELMIQELRVEIGRLQGEEENLRGQLERVRAVKASEEREKTRLRDMAAKVKEQLLQQEKEQEQWRGKVTESKEAEALAKEQLTNLLQLQQQLTVELRSVKDEYHKTVELESESRKKVRLMEDELRIAEQDIRRLTEEYVKEGQSLQAEQLNNNRLNTEMDQVSKELLETWSSLKELMELAPQEAVKHKSYQLWLQASQIIGL